MNKVKVWTPSSPVMFFFFLLLLLALNSSNPNKTNINFRSSRTMYAVVGLTIHFFSGMAGEEGLKGRWKDSRMNRILIRDNWPYFETRHSRRKRGGKNLGTFTSKKRIFRVLGKVEPAANPLIIESINYGNFWRVNKFARVIPGNPWRASIKIIFHESPIGLKYLISTIRLQFFVPTGYRKKVGISFFFLDSRKKCL